MVRSLRISIVVNMLSHVAAIFALVYDSGFGVSTRLVAFVIVRRKGAGAQKLEAVAIAWPQDRNDSQQQGSQDVEQPDHSG
jgi:hypothetical protein